MIRFLIVMMQFSVLTSQPVEVSLILVVAVVDIKKNTFHSSIGLKTLAYDRDNDEQSF